MKEQAIAYRAIRVTLVLMLAAIASAMSAQESGAIRGTVLDQKGKLVSGATVYATPMGRDAGNEKFAETDGKGSFLISGLKWGKYAVTAENIDAGYPRTPLAFYGSKNAAPVLALSAKKPTAGTSIQFRGKATAMTGMVVDDGSSVPIPATFLFRYAKNPANVLVAESASFYRILLPAGIGLTLEVSSPNHKTWYYPGTNDSAKKASLRLEPGHEMTLNIRLDSTSEDCACLDLPKRWGLGPDSPAFQWHELQDEARARACTPPSEPEGMPMMAMQ